MSVINMRKSNDKDKFLSQYPPKAAETYNKVFEYAKPLEKELDKDLSDFNLIELNTLFKGIEFDDVKKAISFGSIIRSYTTFKGKQSPLQNVDKSWYDNFIK